MTLKAVVGQLRTSFQVQLFFRKPQRRYKEKWFIKLDTRSLDAEHSRPMAG